VTNVINNLGSGINNGELNDSPYKETIRRQDMNYRDRDYTPNSFSCPKTDGKLNTSDSDQYVISGFEVQAMTTHISDPDIGIGKEERNVTSHLETICEQDMNTPGGNYCFGSLPSLPSGNTSTYQSNKFSKTETTSINDSTDTDVSVGPRLSLLMNSINETGVRVENGILEIGSVTKSKSEPGICVETGELDVTPTLELNRSEEMNNLDDYSRCSSVSPISVGSAFSGDQNFESKTISSVLSFTEGTGTTKGEGIDPTVSKTCNSVNNGVLEVPSVTNNINEPGDGVGNVELDRDSDIIPSSYVLHSIA
jgi:hypothetical protein